MSKEKLNRNHIFVRPSTRLGWWAVSLAGFFLILYVINAAVFMPSEVDAPWRHVVLPFYGILMMSSGIASGISGLVAVIKKRERSLLLSFPLLLGLFILFLLFGEFLVPH